MLSSTKWTSEEFSNNKKVLNSTQTAIRCGMIKFAQTEKLPNFHGTWNFFPFPPPVPFCCRWWTWRNCAMGVKKKWTILHTISNIIKNKKIVELRREAQREGRSTRRKCNARYRRKQERTRNFNLSSPIARHIGVSQERELSFSSHKRWLRYEESINFSFTLLSPIAHSLILHLAANALDKYDSYDFI